MSEQLPPPPPVLPVALPPPPPPVPGPPSHPVRLVNGDDLHRSRLTVLFRILLVVPHAIWFMLYSLAALPVGIVNWFATLFRGSSPERIHRWLVRYLRYTVFFYSYFNILANPYPPFHGTEGAYPVGLEVDGPAPQRRLITGFRVILAIPAFVLNYVFNYVLQIVGLIGWIVAIFIGRMPKGLESLGLYCLRFQLQTQAYLLVMTDRYPSLSGSEQ